MGKYFLAKLEPYKNKYLKVIFARNYLPSFVVKRKRNEVLNVIECESHRDILLYALQNIIF